MASGDSAPDKLLTLGLRLSEADSEGSSPKGYGSDSALPRRAGDRRPCSAAARDQAAVTAAATRAPPCAQTRLHAAFRIDSSVARPIPIRSAAGLEQVEREDADGPLGFGFSKALCESRGWRGGLRRQALDENPRRTDASGVHGAEPHGLAKKVGQRLPPFRAARVSRQSASVGVGVGLDASILIGMGIAASIGTRGLTISNVLPRCGS